MSIGGLELNLLLMQLLEELGLEPPFTTHYTIQSYILHEDRHITNKVGFAMVNYHHPFLVIYTGYTTIKAHIAAPYHLAYILTEE